MFEYDGESAPAATAWDGASGVAQLGPTPPGEGKLGWLNSDPRGLSTGVGIFDKKDGIEKEIGFRYGTGEYIDSEGHEAEGQELSFSAGKGGPAPGGPLGPVGVEVGMPSASMECKTTDEKFSCGAQANIVSGGIAYQGDETMIKGGLSAGVGGGIRVHYGDTDDDGENEYGVGVDAGPLSGDVKSENAMVAGAVAGATLGAGIGTFLGPGGALVGAGVGAVGGAVVGGAIEYGDYLYDEVLSW